MKLTRWIAAVAVLVFIGAAVSGCKDQQARDRLDKVEAWIDTMVDRANQNLDWAVEQRDSLRSEICRVDPVCDSVPPGTGKNPPDSIPDWP